MKMLFIVLLSVSALAIDIRTDVVGQHQINEIPNFFFKVTPDGKTLAYNHSYTGSEGQNQIMDLPSGRIKDLPGPFDPVFINFTDLMVIPANMYATAYKFYRVDKNTLTYTHLMDENSLSGFYQSVGILSQSPSRVTFRVITEGKRGYHMMRDYAYNISSRQIRPLSSAKQLCPGISLKLPMISKDGRELGAIDSARDKTTIFRISDHGDCQRALRLPQKTGKVNFSHDGRYLTYHIYNTRNTNVTDDWVDAPSSAYVADIFVFDRENSRSFRLTSNTDSNSLYPDFLKNGDIFFVDHPHGGRSKVSFYQVKNRVGDQVDILSGEWQQLDLKPTRKEGGEGFLFQFGATDQIRQIFLRANHGRVKIHELKVTTVEGHVQSVSQLERLLPRNQDSVYQFGLDENIVPKEIYLVAEGYDTDLVRLDIGVSNALDYQEFQSGLWQTEVHPTRASGGESLHYLFDQEAVGKLSLNAQFGRVMVHSAVATLASGRQVTLLANQFVDQSGFSFDFTTGDKITALTFQVEGYDDDRVALAIELSRPENPGIQFDQIANIFNRHNCASCHDNLSSQADMPSEWFTTPATNSPLYDAVETQWMPLGGNPLDEDEIELIRLWIEQN